MKRERVTTAMKAPNAPTTLVEVPLEEPNKLKL
jgi:hypothetical protein